MEQKGRSNSRSETYLFMPSSIRAVLRQLTNTFDEVIHLGAGLFDREHTIYVYLRLSTPLGCPLKLKIPLSRYQGPANKPFSFGT